MDNKKISAKEDRLIPESNRTILDLYVTPHEAYAMWQQNPDRVNVLDVRTFEEYLYVGHLEMARNIPLVFPKYEKSDGSEAPPATTVGGRSRGYSVEVNPAFIPATKEIYGQKDTILVYCATGGRAALAVNQLAAAGFVNVYNIINGLEGDRVDDLGSVYHGKHMRNGWKNSGLPWGYSIHPDLMWEEPEPSGEGKKTEPQRSESA